MISIYATVDTNVLVSALLKPKSNPGIIIEYIRENCIIPLLHEEVIEEYKNVLNREKFGFNKKDIVDLLHLIEEKGIIVNPENIYELMDSKDNIFYSITMEINDAYLITGNTKHFPPAHRILTPTQAVILVTNLNR